MTNIVIKIMIWGLVIALIVVVLVVLYYMETNKRKPEVYQVTSKDGSYQTSFEEALAMAKTFDPEATIATLDQLNEAQDSGAQWCSTGWTATGNPMFPMQLNAKGCGGPGLQKWGPDSQKANVNVYGIKPTIEEVSSNTSGLKVLPWYQPITWANDTKPMKWSRWDP